MTEETKVEITGELSNVWFQYFFDDQRMACGIIENDIRGRFPDGHLIHTSLITKIEGDLIHTMNSVYRVKSYLKDIMPKDEESK